MLSKSSMCATRSKSKAAITVSALGLSAVMRACLNDDSICLNLSEDFFLKKLGILGMRYESAIKH